MKVLIACEFSQVVCRAFRERGHEAYSCDLLPTEGNPAWHIQDDVLKHLHEGWDLMIAHPPCTDLAVSGARWFAQKRADGRQQKAIDFFLTLANAPIPRICMENPVSIISTVWRKPDQIIQPWQFGHGETKAICLWLKNLPLLKPTEIVNGRRHRVWYEPPSAERWKNRSRFFPGIAKAMAEQWGEL
jgi:site-specific DNA-cytosine methylase